MSPRPPQSRGVRRRRGRKLVDFVGGGKMIPDVGVGAGPKLKRRRRMVVVTSSSESENEGQDID